LWRRVREAGFTMRRWATMTTCLPENFFSSSRMRRTLIFWNDLSWGTGTNRMTARFELPVSISLAAVMWSDLSSALSSAVLFSRSKRAVATVFFVGFMN